MLINKSKKIGIILLFSLTVFYLVGCSKTLGTSQKPLESEAFKTMQTTDIKGSKVSSSIFSQNKLTLVNVWNTGCTPCINEIPILDKLNEEYKGKGVSIKGLLLESGVGLTSQEKSTVEDIIKKSKSSYQQLTTSKELLDSELFKQIDSFPTTFFIDKEGNIVDNISGSNDYDGWKSLIEKTLERLDSND